MITIDSKINKQIAKNLSLEGMYVTREQQIQILHAINNEKKLQMNLFVKSLLNNEIYSNFSKGIKLS
ncbi:hypothetical protein UM590_11165 [Staphylococcus aureus]|nr:hypothetical protein UM590_11165 [Staphylococcus aureus]